MSPLPFTAIVPRLSKSKVLLRRLEGRVGDVDGSGTPCDSMRLAVFTVSPHTS